MQFKKYFEIDNISDKDTDKTTTIYVVTEKIHGANVSFWTDGTTIKSARRNDFLGEKEESKFYNIHLLKEQLEGKILAVFNHFAKCVSECKVVAIFGEICGGSYISPDVVPVKGAKRVQKEVSYCPYNIFYAFDVLVNGKFISYEDSEQIFRECGIFYAKPLFKGILEECKNYPHVFPTSLPVELCLPPLENNDCEGIIIRKYSEPATRWNVFKKKNPAFNEVLPPRRGRKPKDTVIPQTLAEIFRYLSENRLNNVLSKETPEKQGDLPHISKMFVEDALKDFEKDNPGVLAKIDKKKRSIIRKNVGTRAFQIVKSCT